MKKIINCLLLIVFLFPAFCASNVSAANISTYQQNVITKKGVVLDENGDTMPGVNVSIKGTTNGVNTDLDGAFILDVKLGDVILISFVGYKDQELKVTDDKSIKIKLVPDTEKLDEVIIVGYGVQRKKDKTGAIVRVSADDISEGVLTDPIQGIMGKVAGVNITKKGGDPNGGFNVQIRGTAGLKSGTSPLYVVDGVPGVDPTTIAASDIESFNVLKDASSAAIYGSRGATGVIIITTKKGSFNQKGKLTYNGYTSADVVANRLKLYSADDIRAYAKKKGLSFSDQGASTNWQDEIYRTGITQSHNLAFSGGGSDHIYRASVNYENFEGVIKGTEKERLIARLNATQKLLDDKLTVSMNLAGTFENNQYQKTDGSNGEAVMFQAFARNPSFPVRNADGSYFEVKDFENANPNALINQINNRREAKRFLANVKADLEIVDGLVGGVNVSYRRDDNENWYSRPSYQINTSDGGYAKRNYENSYTKMFEGTLKYNKVFNSMHNVGALAGYSWQQDGKDSFGAQGRDMLSDIVGSDNLKFANDVLPQDIWSWKEQNRLISFIGRFSYNYDSRYYLTGTIRKDGSSKFGANHEWGWFPSFSAAWDLSREGFLSDYDWLDQFKFRVGFGVTGNQEIGNYNDIARIHTDGRTLDPNTGKKTLIIKQASNANPDLKWEENKEWNFGIDFSIINNRLTGSIDYYNKTTSDLLAEYSVPVPPNRYDKIYANAGEISNKGLEINLVANILTGSDLSWKSTLSYSHNKQEVVSLSDGDYNLENMKVSWINGRGLVGMWSQLVKPGFELGTFYGWKNAGIDQNGNWLFYTKDGKLTNAQNDEDRQVIGHALPDFTMSMTNSFVYKNWDLNFTLRAVVGGDVLNVTKMVLGNPRMLPNSNALEGTMEMGEMLNDSPKYSDYYIEDGSFLRLDNLSLGYTVNTKKNKYISSCRFYLSSNNLFTLTKYSGIDPESNYGGFENLGVDMYDVYPKTRTFTVGMKIGF
ncbi:MAG: TonB-dependent receptor [Marinifilaceae bacterium]